MKLCIPAASDAGLDAPVSGHFGRAPFFTFVDTDTGAVESVPNPGHETTHPPDLVLAHRPDTLAVRGLGRGAYTRFRAAGVRLLATDAPDVAGTVAAARAGTLRPLTEHDVHAGHHGRSH